MLTGLDRTGPPGHRAAGPPGRGAVAGRGPGAAGPSDRRASGPWRAVGRGPAFSKTRFYQLYISLWTSRFLVLNILVRRDLFSAERSNVQLQQDLRPRFLQLISLFLTPTATLKAQRKSINFARSYLTVEWSCEGIKWSMTSRVCFGSFLTKVRSVHREKKQVKHFIFLYKTICYYYYYLHHHYYDYWDYHYYHRIYFSIICAPCNPIDPKQCKISFMNRIFLGS